MPSAIICSTQREWLDRWHQGFGMESGHTWQGSGMMWENIQKYGKEHIMANMKQYAVFLEISGATAMWTRPDTGDSPVSYPVPTWSAAKGIFESIVRIETVEIIPTMVEICAPVTYHGYTTNYGGPLRKSSVMPHASYQLLATVLINVCYRFYGELKLKPTEYVHPSERAHLQIEKGRNQLHVCQEIFNRRLTNGQCYELPFLGWREFMPNYVGPFRETTKVEENINLVLPSLLHAVFEPSGRKNPQYKQDKAIKNGRLEYA
jgi:CRISPR-associated protein Cas5d